MQRYSNIIQGLVYAGAAFLVVIVGLRGLGDLSTLEMMPGWLLDEATGRISVNIVIAGLVAEFAMLMALAIVFFKVPAMAGDVIANTKTHAHMSYSATADVAKLVESERQIIETLGKRVETLVESERRIIEHIGKRHDEIAEAQRHLLELIARRVGENQVGNDETLKRIESNVDFLKSAHLVRRHPVVSEGSPTLS